MYKPVLIVDEPIKIPLISASIFKGFTGYREARIALPVEYVKIDQKEKQ